MELNVVSTLNQLAKTPENRAVIVRDPGCLPGLLLFIDNADSKVALLALETLRMLSECDSNRSVMQNQEGMMISMELLLTKHSSPDADQVLIRNLAKEIQNNILNGKSANSQNLKSKNTGGASGGKVASGLTAGGKTSLSATQHPTSSASGANSVKGQIFTTSSRKARSVVLHITGMDDSVKRKTVEDKLLTVSGVISFTFDSKAPRVIIRAKADIRVDLLCLAVASSKNMTAQQVVKNEMGEEVLLDIIGASVRSSTTNKENAKQQQQQQQQISSAPASSKTPVVAKLPDYLPEDEEMSEDAKLASKTALARVHDEGNNKNSGNGWWGAVSGYISKSLYW